MCDDYDEYGPIEREIRNGVEFERCERCLRCVAAYILRLPAPSNLVLSRPLRFTPDGSMVCEPCSEVLGDDPLYPPNEHF